ITNLTFWSEWKICSLVGDATYALRRISSKVYKRSKAIGCQTSFSLIIDWITDVRG
ncbi:his Kinase A domain protein, partial [Vibrio parahaemolyticus V-223/04]